ncbi:hypothetical protein [Streptacidiphilus sp. EB129]|uniref:hypothetical protein n=1 Tax=Streptacidiphilus sp. EB129 TaxID=3156262 RepID=UPI003511A960
MEAAEWDEGDFDETDEPFEDTCDECGRLLQMGLYEGDDPLLSVVPDSSAVYRDYPERDGKRMVMVCSAECLRKIERRYGQRPFDESEVWAGKIAWVVMTHGGTTVSNEALEQETGLDPTQILAGFDWLEHRRPRSRSGPDSPPQ